ncbi:hypothetical protein BLL42_00610 [Pseudomonas frederiksbergensis]|uniref:Fap n=1 Tax=Pseudomonas frederiksbergensis TaxID=104087 RepID=A0A1J0EEJ0_9PSED|nr:hypothetical protein [Pseudomonas frederiksbergensis]APC14312.1 hypothetical protein BLL42_00610 [Pseudomonas frederiksbergensis]
MGNIDKGIFRLLLIGCALGSSISLPVQAADGIIILQRTVQPRIATHRPMVPDPNPLTVNANPSKQVVGATNELTDGDIAGISSGASIAGIVVRGTGTLSNTSDQSQLPGLSAGHSAGSGNSVANRINGSIQQGLGSLKLLSGGQ